MPNVLPSYPTASPIQTLTQMLESDHVEHIFPIKPHAEHIYCIQVGIVFCYIFILEDINLFQLLENSTGNKVYVCMYVCMYGCTYVS